MQELATEMSNFIRIESVQNSVRLFVSTRVRVPSSHCLYVRLFACLSVCFECSFTKLPNTDFIVFTFMLLKEKLLIFLEWKLIVYKFWIDLILGACKLLILGCFCIVFMLFFKNNALIQISVGNYEFIHEQSKATHIVTRLLQNVRQARKITLNLKMSAHYPHTRNLRAKWPIFPGK